MKKNPPISGTDVSGINRKIERAKQELEHMIDLNPQIILLINRECTVLRANKAAVQFLELAGFESILNKHIRDILPAEDPELLEKTIRTHSGYDSVDITVNLPVGGRRILRVSTVGAGSSQDFLVMILNDITHERKYAGDLEKQHKKEAVGALAGALMHVVNQPLTVIVLRSQMLKMAMERNKIDAGEIRESLQDIMRLALEISDVLQKTERPRDFVTEEYSKGVNILDIGKSGRLPDELQLTRSVFLDDLINALDSRIPGSRDHARRTGEIACIICREMRLDPHTTETARQAAIVHDIGKLAVPDSIILKPSALTGEETAIMARHVETGYNILKGLMFFEDESEALMAHHERYDGTGYPRGIQGPAIPLSARIVAVADAFDVMRTGRPYRKAISLPETAEEMKRNAGTQFDPEIVEVMLKHLPALDAVITHSS